MIRMIKIKNTLEIQINHILLVGLEYLSKNILSINNK